jgi:hypothetical protein
MPKLLKEISSASIYISQESVSDPFIIISHLADSLEGMSLLGRNTPSLQQFDPTQAGVQATP